MKVLFSKRHQESLRNKKLVPSFSGSIRTSIVRILTNFSEFDEEYGAWVTKINAENELKTFYGTNTLMAFDKDNKRSKACFDELIMGGYPSEVLDAVEAWLYVVGEKREACEIELNDLFAMNHNGWRLINGEAHLLDAAYLLEEIQEKALRKMREIEAYGAMEEFQGGLTSLKNGDPKEAIIKAHKSVESMMKFVLSTEGHRTYGALLSDLVKSELIPKYYDDFFVHFEKIVLGIAKERNLPGRGHGQGADILEVSPNLAEFAINISGAINMYLVQCWFDKRERRPLG